MALRHAVVLAALGATGALYAQQREAPVTAIIHAHTYLTPGEPATEDATIIFSNGRITAAGRGIALPANAKVIDAHAATVTPGLMNSDSQIGVVETGTDDTKDTSVSSGPLGAAFDIQYGLNPNSTLLPVARADGLTRVSVLPTGSGEPPFAGMGAILRLSEGTDIVDTTQASEVVNMGGMVSPATGGSRNAQWLYLRRALQAAQAMVPDQHAQDAGYTGDPMLSPANLRALVPVLERKRPLVINASRESDLRQAAALVDDFRLHVVLVGAEEGWRVAPLLAQHGIDVVLDPLADSPAFYDQIGARLENAAILDRAGVRISFKATFVHVSYNPGIAIREGAGIAVANGLPWDHALAALTRNAAATWNIAGHYGTLQPGQDADIVLWDGDPLEPSSAPTAVFVRGLQVSLETRQTLLEKRYSPAHSSDPMPPAYRNQTPNDRIQP